MAELSSSSSCQAALAVALVSSNIIPFSPVSGVLFLPGLSGQVKAGWIWLEVTPQLSSSSIPHPWGSSSLRQGRALEVNFVCCCQWDYSATAKPGAVNKWVKKKKKFIFRTGTMINMWNLSRVCLLYLFEMQSACLLKCLSKGQHNLWNECSGLLESR